MTRTFDFSAGIGLCFLELGLPLVFLFVYDPAFLALSTTYTLVKMLREGRILVLFKNAAFDNLCVVVFEFFLVDPNSQQIRYVALTQALRL